MKNNFKELERNVIQWAKDKGILESGNPLAQARKTLEEANELTEACEAQSRGLFEFKNSKGNLVNTKYEIEDGIGDTLVTLIIQSKLQNLKIEDCLASAYDVIKRRSGQMIDGQFVKD